MKHKIIIAITMTALLFPLGKMPKEWGSSNTYSNNQSEIVGSWNMDTVELIKWYRTTDDYLNAGEFAELAVTMISTMFTAMTFNFKDDGTYILNGLPAMEEGQPTEVNGEWHEEDGKIIVKSPEEGNEDDLVFKISGNRLIPLSKNAEFFYFKKSR